MADNEKDYETREGVGVVGGGGVTTAEEARSLHHLATADPEREREDGLLTGPAHEAKYGLERAKASAARWRASGVHPIENRALVPGEEGAENLRGAAVSADEIGDNGPVVNSFGQLETTNAAAAPENAAAPTV